ncbi:CAP domain-containing protein [Afifella sp. JA880]|uniref:CAP domain-containing protein n=1 Tax=Afifella sp. JA880 TaxID=2975280 RepID=UPI0021BB554F|nr:CAP domain-containing protein [Afifella sp. JA880]MCT8269091.1 CAP domain-containing protein [Afifella sp. JA880]
MRSFILVVTLLLAACAGPSEKFEARNVPVDEAAMRAMVTEYRARHGLGPVTVSPRLNVVAERQALAMARENDISHTVAGKLPKRVAAVGYDWGAIAENLGGGYKSEAAAFQGWVASPGHEKNLRNPYVTEIGFAGAVAPTARSGGFYALILGTEREPRQAMR